jgi:hypothetical protein
MRCITVGLLFSMVGTNVAGANTPPDLALSVPPGSTLVFELPSPRHPAALKFRCDLARRENSRDRCKWVKVSPESLWKPLP